MQVIRTPKRLLSLDRPKIMGILNVTPDSFYAKSRSLDLPALLDIASEMLEQGADILDIGGQSTRPNAIMVPQQEERRRLEGLVAAILQRHPEACLSVDTFYAETARLAADEGAEIINDVSGGRIDPAILELVAEKKLVYVLMHSRGTPQTMSGLCQYSSLLEEMIDELLPVILRLAEMGHREVLVDPGFGFAKTLEQNYQLLRELGKLHCLEKPLLVGLSRKSMVHKMLQIKPEEALPGSLALEAYALQKGANILRVHDVKETKQMLRCMEELLYV